MCGLVLMGIISKIDYRIYKKFDKVAYFGSIMILAAVAIPGLGWSAGGATRWINLKFTTFQPSEIAKIALVIFYATYLTNNRDKLGNLWEGFFRPFLFLVPIIAILILVQSHLSATILIILIIAVMMIMAGSKLRYFITFGSAAAIGGGALLYILAEVFDKGKYRLARLTAFLNPWDDPTDTGWQIIQSLYAIGSGGLFGVGLGNSTQKYLYLPEPQNDFIFAVIAEELGFVGCIIVIALFAIFVWRGVLISMKAPDMFGSLLATGITSIIGLQALINIAVVTSSMPNTGMPLPFFSYGGTSLLILLCSVGVLLNISRQTKKI